MSNPTSQLDFKQFYQRIKQGEATILVDQPFLSGRRFTMKLDDAERSYVAKLFTYDKDMELTESRPWEHEENILRAMSGVIAPKTFGFESWQEGDQMVFLYLREYLEGDELTSVGTDQIPAMAKYLASLHQQGITSNDPYIYNFITIDGTPLIIDFGKATQQAVNSSKHHYLVGRELFKLYRGTLGYDAKLMEQFWQSYFAQFEKQSWYRQALLKFSVSLHSLRQMIRNIGRKRPARS
ncbi:hypothetical protein EZV61_07985 [Corallincola luteus]|uniref:Protein kinase domain-containing protein n=1 Tax=Corallincola luteus TaxID=1775177 RepID=A0ABY2AP53_9GAMM|nr:hypothetical protein [Corallincola luteus]TCI04114.1 hypothetical protein EZV61_07985 [Corallincola luteus]